MPLARRNQPAQPIPLLRTVQDAKDRLTGLRAIRAVASELDEYDRLTRELDCTLDILSDLQRHERKAA